MLKKNVSKLTSVIHTFKLLFECMDVVFAKLRILSPIEKEIKEIKMAIQALEKLWLELDLNITPKMHILTTHTLDQVIRFGGIADKVEDFVEKAHQLGKKLDHLVARMNSRCFRQKELVKIRRQWLSSNPLVSKQITIVNQQRKRKCKDSLTTKPKHTRCQTIKKIKEEKRCGVMRKIFDE